MHSLSTDKVWTAWSSHINTASEKQRDIMHLQEQVQYKRLYSSVIIVASSLYISDNIDKGQSAHY